MSSAGRSVDVHPNDVAVEAEVCRAAIRPPRTYVEQREVPDESSASEIPYLDPGLPDHSNLVCRRRECGTARLRRLQKSELPSTISADTIVVERRLESLNSHFPRNSPRYSTDSTYRDATRATHSRWPFAMAENTTSASVRVTASIWCCEPNQSLSTGTTSVATSISDPSGVVTAAPARSRASSSCLTAAACGRCD